MPNPRCSGERYITRKEFHSFGFELDLHKTLLSIADGSVGEEAALAQLKSFEERPMSSITENQLKLCLGRVASGQCPNYPIFNL